MSKIYRVFSEKKKGFDVEASSVFKDIRDNLRIESLKELRMLVRYDICGIDGETLEKEVTLTVNNFCKAAGDLSETQTGALVVFEKDAPLQEIIKSGTVLDAQSSPELFNGLFFKNSALHDGAVVVKEGRIHSAGCILPLTQNTSLASELGTRHRAAIGMSEQSDAVVVVVSEETGSISVARNGVLTRDVTSGSLREILLDEFINKNDYNDEQNNNKLLGKLFSKKGGNKNEK